MIFIDEKIKSNATRIVPKKFTETCYSLPIGSALLPVLSLHSVYSVTQV